MLYSMGRLEATAALPRVVDAPVIWRRNNSTRIVAEHGVDTVLTWLAANEEVAA
jgi:hypothetical protein